MSTLEAQWHRCLLPLAASFLVAANTSAVSTNSQWSVYTWRSDDGLPNNDVVSLAQTADGYLWVATDSHLARFDGAQFEELFSHQFLPGVDRKIISVLPGRDGELFLGLAQGPVTVLKNGVAETFSNLPQKFVRSLFQDREGALWVAYGDGTICRVKNGMVQHFGKSSGLPYGYHCSLANGRDSLWFLKGNNIGHFRDGRFETTLTLPRYGNIRMTGASDGGIWICNHGKFFKYDEPGGLKNLGQFDGDAETMMEARDGSVWIGTCDNGLFRFNGKNFEHITTSHPQILSLLEDREGNIWAGTGGGGLDRINPTLIALQDGADGLPLTMLQSLCEDANHTIWAVNDNGLLLSCANGKWQTVTNAGKRIENATCVAADKSGSVWIGCMDYKLLRWNDGKFAEWTKTNGIKGDSIHALLAGRNGNIWIGSGSPTALQCLRGDKILTFNLPKNTSRIGAITEDVDGTIWCGTAKGGLLRIHDNKVVDEQEKMGAPAKTIRALYATPDGALWIGYAGVGLGRYKNGQFARVTADQGLYDNRISQIISDNDGWLWCAADRGIFKIWPRDFADVANGRDNGLQSVHYGRDEGLNSLQASYGVSPGILRSHDGRLWIPMRTALAVVTPGRWNQDTNPPQVLLTRIAVDGKTVAEYGGALPVRNAVNLQEPQEELKLNPDHQRIDFDFTALSFRSPENVEFGYKLDGLDKDWLWIDGERSASYSQLPAGTYRFRVMACNGDGIWNSIGTSVAFTVAPYFWQTWWFRIGTLVVFTGLGVGLAYVISARRMRLKMQALERQAALDKERARIARDIHDDAGGHLTKIVLLSELTLQQAPPEKIVERVKQTADAAREVLKSLDETIWAINPRHDTLRDLVDYISQFAVNFLQTAGVRCRVDLPAEIPDRPVSAEVRHNLFLAVKEALNNVARHARATEAWLRIRVNAESLNVIIEDNGCGFDQQPVNGDADGLRNMRHRLEESGGRFGVRSKAGEGTKIVFTYDFPGRNN